MTRRPPLPMAWYSTLPELAHEWGTHPDRILYFCDAGLIEPAVLVPKAALPFDCPGPASHVCVLLPDYRTMAWSWTDTARVAPLVGEFRAYQVDGHEFKNIWLRECDGVLVSRSDLVIPLDQREALEAMGATTKPINPTERRTLLRILGFVLHEAYGNVEQPYALAESISRQFELIGAALSKQSIAQKIIAARESLTAAERDGSAIQRLTVAETWPPTSRAVR